MSRVNGSSAARPARSVKNAPRARGETNIDWLARQLDDLEGVAAAEVAKGQRQVEDPSYVLLLGGRGPYDFRVRVAQSQLRHDLSPSHWSHTGLVKSVGRSLRRSLLIESSLEPRFGFGLPATTNGVQETELDWYADTHWFANIAVLQVPVSASIWPARTTRAHISLLERFAKQRAVLDVPDLVLEWLAFVWGVGAAGNPLLSGHGIPSAAVVETLLGAAGYDISPGLDRRSTSPEAFWQTAKWWYPYFAEQRIDPVNGRYVIGHRIDTGEVRPRPAQPRPDPR